MRVGRDVTTADVRLMTDVSRFALGNTQSLRTRIRRLTHSEFVVVT
jgi:hypothetical protein